LQLFRHFFGHTIELEVGIKTTLHNKRSDHKVEQ
jgi:hypothetical protein